MPNIDSHWQFAILFEYGNNSKNNERITDFNARGDGENPG